MAYENNWLVDESLHRRASGSIDDRSNIPCFAVCASRKNVRSRADAGVF